MTTNGHINQNQLVQSPSLYDKSIDVTKGINNPYHEEDFEIILLSRFIFFIPTFFHYKTKMQEQFRLQGSLTSISPIRHQPPQ